MRRQPVGQAGGGGVGPLRISDKRRFTVYVFENLSEICYRFLAHNVGEQKYLLKTDLYI